MGVGARARRAVRVCDIMCPVTLTVCGRDPCALGPGLRDPVSRLTQLARVVVSLVECVRGPPGSRGSVAHVGVSLCAGSARRGPARGISA